MYILPEIIVVEIFNEKFTYACIKLFLNKLLKEILISNIFSRNDQKPKITLLSQFCLKIFIPFSFIRTQMKFHEMNHVVRMFRVSANISSV